MGALGAGGRGTLGQGKSPGASLGSNNSGTPAVNREQVRTVHRAHVQCFTEGTISLLSIHLQ